MTQNTSDAEAVLQVLAAETPSTGVTVLPRSGNEIPYPNCLVVEPFRDAAQNDQLCASVEHFVEIQNPTGFPWKITPVNNEPIGFKDAVELAMAYAQRHGVPVILVNHDDLSSAAERQQTDTTVLNMRSPRSAS